MDGAVFPVHLIGLEQGLPGLDCEEALHVELC